uniref:Vacuolar protein sorting-associated protein 13A n=1 Tax=Ditylenchus dipsaci TaxID=166011 RepID=A0A915CSW2_9BILA
MVFESIVADVLNRFLGDFVENLDASKLNIGIWGGDVKLNNLEIKETALDDLDLPIKLKFGYLDSLVLKIPWKNLYTEPVLADIEGLNLIIVPNKGVVYNEEKAKKNAFETKQKVLNRLELNRLNKRKPKDPDQDSFTEKYEDRYSNRSRPFAAGITLEGLDFQTTDSNFKTTIHKETMKIFFKLVSLKNLAVYWNSESQFISDLDSKEDIRKALMSTVASANGQPDDYKYIFGPISMDARLKLNQKPEADGSNWKIPKVDLNIEMGKLSVFLGKLQYQDLLLFLEAQERFNLAERYLKHRPNLTEYRGHYKVWWHCAYNCILEDIHRKRDNWSWERMKNHRKLVKEYKAAWIRHRTEKNASNADKMVIEEAEKKLDVFNLNIARQQAEMDIDRQQLTRTEDQQGKLSGQEVVAQLEKAITPEEKAKLFDAIDYQENIPSTDYPKHYVENRISIQLNTVLLAVDDALVLSMQELFAHVEQRSSAKAIHIKTGVKSVSMDGCGQSMLSLLDTSRDWLHMEIITNPLDGSFDQYVGFHVAPVLLKYHSPVVNRVLEVFKPPGEVRLHQLTTAAIARYEEVKARSTTGLQYAVEQKTKLKLEIRLEPATIVLSQGGSFDESKPSLMAELGVLTINTVDDVSGFHYGDTTDEKLRRLIIQAYDKFQLKLSNVQLLFADCYEKCMDARGDTGSPFHVLKPMEIELNLCKASVADLQIENLRIYGDLPKVSVCISDVRLTQLLELLMSIPTPDFAEEDETGIVDLAAPVSTANLRDRAKMKAIMDVKGWMKRNSIGEMSALLCSRKNALVSGECLEKSDCALAFGELTLKKLSMSGYMTEDGSLKCELSLVSLTMDDRRKESKVPRLLDKKNTSSDEAFFYALYQQNPNGEKKVELTSSQFYLLLSPEFLGALSNFVVVPNMELDTDAKSAIAELKTSSGQTSKPSGDTPKKPGDVPVAGSLTMKCRIREVEVILIENSFKPDDSQALILSFNTFLDAQNESGIQHFEGSVQNLQITSTYFAEHKRHISSYPVLKKLDIVLSGSIVEETKAQDFVIAMDNVHVKVSPSIIRLLSAVATQFTSQQSQEESSKGGKAVLKQYTDYWSPKKIEKRKYWWFREVAEQTEAAVEGGAHQHDIARTVAVPDHSEKAEFAIERFVVTVEAGLGDFTTPMILVESSVKAAAENWTSQLGMDASLQLQVSYYNEAFNVWEPVVEPVQNKENGLWEAWALSMQVRSHGEEEEMPQEAHTPDVIAKPNAQPPKMVVSIEAKEMMDITVTKSLIQLLQELGKSFEDAAKQISPPKSRELPGSAPYLVFNETGLDLKICQSETLKTIESPKSVDAPHGQFVELDVVDSSKTVIGLQLAEDNRRSDLLVELMGTQREVNVMRAEKRCVRLPKEADSGKQYSMLVDTKLENGRHVICLKSLVQFINHLDQPIEVHALRGTSVSMCGVAQPNQEPLHVPLPLLYTATGEFHFKPADESYDLSNDTICWHDFEHLKRSPVRCDLTSNNTQGFYIDTVIEEEKVMGEKGKHFIDKLFTVHLFPPLFLRNHLPVPIHIHKPVDLKLEGGEGVQLNIITGLGMDYSVEYDEVVYSGKLVKQAHHEDLETTKLLAKEDEKKSLQLGLNWATQNLRQELSIYAPYWMVNNTNKRLQYMEFWPGSKLPGFCSCAGGRAADKALENHVCHLPDENPLLLPVNDENFFDNKKAKVNIDGSQWSTEFPLDTAGSQGRVTCRGVGREYELTVDVQLTRSGLTKVVTLSPFYLINNDSRFDIEVRENGTSEWLRVPAESCVDLWPVQESKRKTMTARFAGQEQSTILFPFTETFDAFCKIDSPHIGMNVVCSIAESSSVIHIEPFSPGMVPAILMNATKFPITFKQTTPNGNGRRGSTAVTVDKEQVLEPWHYKAFTWADVTVKNRSLEWTCDSHKQTTDLMRNEFGHYEPSKQYPGYHYWVSFLNGRQRVLLFTNDLAIVTTASEAYEVERLDLQVELSLHGIGMSLVNNLEGLEVLYLAMSSSGIQWEQCQKNRYKAMAVKSMEEFESEYQKWVDKGSPDGWVTSTDYELDFKNWVMRKKGAKKSEVKFRRSFQSGLWMQYRQSPHQTAMHLKLNHVQIDNQLPACVFPCILAAVPPPKSVVANNVPRPFAEFSFVMIQSEHSNVVQIKYLRVLIQEFAIRIDNGLINSALALFSAEATQLPPYSKELFAKDLELTKPQLSQRAITTAASQIKAYYDDLHISPLMMHLSFSQGGTLGGDKKSKANQGGGTNIQSELLNVILKSVGVSLTELQDIVFKLAYFERKCKFYSRDELQAEIQSHYTKQFIKQLYVLVLGLDIIGNPFGLVRDLTSGVTDLFYQPFQGAIQGPEEFAEGAALGIQSLFGHTVGGAAGAVSRIAGTLGKGIAALTMDEDYQRKRQEAINRRPQNIGEGLSRGAKGVGQGVYDGVTGVFFKPIEGAREGGIGGFARGVGKGLIGVVARPVSGVVDFASGTFDSLKTIAGNSEETKPIRPSRLILSDQIIRPYSYEDAIGYKIFRDTDRGKFVDTDHFVTYAVISDRFVFLVTDVRVILSKHQDILGNWTADWELTYSEIKEPKRTPKGVTLELKQKKKGFLGIGASSGKVIEFKNADVAKKVADKLISAYEQFG